MNLQSPLQLLESACVADCFDPRTSRVLRSCLRRISTWSPPPNWSFADWFEEVAQTAQVAAFTAVSKPPQPVIGPDSERNRYQCVFNCLRKDYRKEWSFASHTQTDLPLEETEADSSPAASLAHIWSDASPIPFSSPLVRCSAAIDELQPHEREIIHQLFWDGHSEKQLARALGISRRSLNKRKRKIFGRIRQLLSTN